MLVYYLDINAFLLKNKFCILILIRYHILLWMQRCKDGAGKSIALGSTGMAFSNVANVKRLRDSQNQNFPG